MSKLAKFTFTDLTVAKAKEGFCNTLIDGAAMDCELNQEIFGRIKGEFDQLGLLGRVVKLKLEGKLFRVRCDDRVFTVYRVNSGAHLPPGLPGYAVCRLAPDECFALDRAESHDTGCLDRDHLSQARDWARLALEELRSAG